jgi:hypothetical protein
MKNLQIVHQKLNVVVKNTRVIIDIIQVDYLSPFFLIKNSFLFVDVRQEAVKQALEQFGARPIPSSKRILNPQTKRTSIKHLVFLNRNQFFYSDESSDDDEDDDDESSSTYATTTDDQHNKESSISPPIQNHHYQNPPTVESILKSNQSTIIPAFPLKLFSS